MTATCDILMVTHDRPDYVRLSLPRLLETCDDDAAVWLWHNGEHAETLRLVREFAEHPKVTRFHHSIKNVQLREPTNWLLGNSTADLLGKVDDDNLMPMGWLDKLRDTHAADWSLSCVGCWTLRVEDID
ncbi:MAG: glycosyltransferase family A protein [Planctomycetota bacterium]